MLFLLSMLVPVALVGLVASGDDAPDEIIDGTAEDDELEGTTGADLVSGLGGDDVVNGLAGNDTLFGQAGDDILEGEDGDDMLCSGDGDDIVTGNRGQDMIEGQAGDDWISGDYNGDELHGNQGEDTIIGGRGWDHLHGEEGDDVMFGGIIEGLPLNDEQMVALRDGASLADINGQIEMRDDSIGNRFFGGEGDDQMFLGSGDEAHGEEGADTFNILADQNQDNAGPALLMDYNGDEDAITLVVDGDLDDFDVEVETSDEGETAIRVNGELVGCIMDGAGEGLTAADITLLQQSDVASLFDPNAAAAA